MWFVSTKSVQSGLYLEYNAIGDCAVPQPNNRWRCGAGITLMYSVLSAFCFRHYLVSCQDCSDPDSCGSGKAMEEGGEESPQNTSGNFGRRFDPFANLGDDEDGD